MTVTPPFPNAGMRPAKLAKGGRTAALPSRRPSPPTQPDVLPGLQHRLSARRQKRQGASGTTSTTITASLAEQPRFEATSSTPLVYGLPNDGGASIMLPREAAFERLPAPRIQPAAPHALIHPPPRRPLILPRRGLEPLITTTTTHTGPTTFIQRPHPVPHHPHSHYNPFAVFLRHHQTLAITLLPTLLLCIVGLALALCGGRRRCARRRRERQRQLHLHQAPEKSPTEELVSPLRLGMPLAPPAPVRLSPASSWPGWEEESNGKGEVWWVPEFSRA